MGSRINRAAECSIELLRKLLTYEHLTGKLYWKYREPNLFRSATRQESIARTWNAAHAGREAFTSVDKDGYYCGAILNRLYRAQRVCFAIHHGYWPDEVDHKNGVRSDNQIENLNDAGSTGNMKNLAMNSRNTSGHMGVSLTPSGSWKASIGKRGSKEHRQKIVKLKADAIELRLGWEKELGYSETHGRREREYHCS